MACNTCAKSFSLLRQEKGCPGCGFSYCSKCINTKIFLKKLNSEAKVCLKCKKKFEDENAHGTIEAPDAYYRRADYLVNDDKCNIGKKLVKYSEKENSIEEIIYLRLQKLKEDDQGKKESTDNNIEDRLRKLKGNLPAVPDAELQSRLANIKGFPNPTMKTKPMNITVETRSQQEQADDLLKQYVEEINIDSKYNDDFDRVLSNIERRLQNLQCPSTSNMNKNTGGCKENYEEEKMINKILEEVKTETEVDGGLIKELFCEICNEDAKMKCNGCEYLYCKSCFLEHRDDDYGCNNYEKI